MILLLLLCVVVPQPKRSEAQIMSGASCAGTSDIFRRGRLQQVNIRIKIIYVLCVSKINKKYKSVRGRKSNFGHSFVVRENDTHFRFRSFPPRGLFRSKHVADIVRARPRQPFARGKRSEIYTFGGRIGIITI